MRASFASCEVLYCDNGPIFTLKVPVAFFTINPPVSICAMRIVARFDHDVHPVVRRRVYCMGFGQSTLKSGRRTHAPPRRPECRRFSRRNRMNSLGKLVVSGVAL